MSRWFLYAVQVCFVCIFSFFINFPFFGNTLSNASAELVIESVTFTPSSPVKVGQAVTFTVTAESSSAFTEFEWDFGDSTDDKDIISKENVIDHSYTKAGPYRVFIKVRNLEGDFDTVTTSILVIEQDTEPNGPDLKRSASIFVDKDSRRVWICNHDNNSVSVVNADSLVLEKEIKVCKKPSSVTKAGSNMFVACKDNDKIMAINSTSLAVSSEFNLPWGARADGILAFSEQALYLSFEGKGEVVKVDSSTGKIIKTIPLGHRPRAMALSPDNSTLAVTNFISDKAGLVWLIDTNSDTLKSSIELQGDTTTIDSSGASRGLPNYLQGISFNPKGTQIWVSGKKDNIFAGLVVDKDKLDLAPESTVRSFIGMIDVASNSEVIENRIDINDNGMIGASLIPPVDRYLISVLPTNNVVSVVDTVNGSVISQATTEAAPVDMAVDPVTSRIFTVNLVGRSTTVIDGKSVLLNGNIDLKVIKNIKTITNDIHPPEVVRGKKVFYDAADDRMAQTHYMSCASCHFEGGEDGRVWDFTGRGEGLRNTTTMIGSKGDQHGPVHWTGNFDEIQDFEGPIRDFFSGFGFIPDEIWNDPTRDIQGPLANPKKGLSQELDDLQTYVNSLNSPLRSPYKNSDGSYSSDALKGAAIFFSTDCIVCHAGPMLSDSETGISHNLETIIPSSGKRLGGKMLLDTPPLIGLAHTPPYLHDGRAKTIEEVFNGKNHSDRTHDVIDRFGAENVKYLERFMLEIDEYNDDKNNNGKPDLEDLAKTAPRNDTDNDSLDDSWEITYFNDLRMNGNDDPDKDGLSNIEEERRDTNPISPDLNPGPPVPTPTTIATGIPTASPTVLPTPVNPSPNPTQRPQPPTDVNSRLKVVNDLLELSKLFRSQTKSFNRKLRRTESKDSLAATFANNSVEYVIKFESLLMENSFLSSVKDRVEQIRGVVSELVNSVREKKNVRKIRRFVSKLRRVNIKIRIGLIRNQRRLQRRAR